MGRFGLVYHISNISVDSEACYLCPLFVIVFGNVLICGVKMFPIGLKMCVSLCVYSISLSHTPTPLGNFSVISQLLCSIKYQWQLTEHKKGFIQLMVLEAQVQKQIGVDSGVAFDLGNGR